MDSLPLTHKHVKLFEGTPNTHRRVILVRHGETDWNASKRFQGHTDIPLNALGLRQAQALAAHLRLLEKAIGRPVAHRCISSDLGRAHDTARILWNGMPKLHVEPKLRERDYGDLSGLTGDEMEAQHPEAFAGLKERAAHSALPGGESLHAFNLRVLTAFHSMLSTYPNEDLLLVAHGGVLDCIYRHCKSEPLEKQREWLLPNAALNFLHAPKGTSMPASHGSIEVMLWADQSHLEFGLDGTLPNSKDEVDGRIA